MPKILKLVDSCGKCPHHGYYSEGQHECKLVGEIVVNKEAVAPFCPLPDYPAKIIADLARTVRVERDLHQYSFSYMTVAHVARKFKTNMTGRGTTFTLKDGTTISLEFDHITSIDLRGTEIFFMSGDKNYRIAPDIKEPTLYAAVQVPNKAEMGWTRLELAR